MRTRYAVALILMTTTASSTWAQTQSGINDWSLFLSLRETRRFDRTANGIPTPDRVADSASAGLAYSTRTEQSTVRFNGRIGANTQREPATDERGRLTYGVGFSWNYRSSARSQMSLSQRVSKNIRLDTLSELGVLPRGFGTFSATTSWSYQYQSGPRTSWSTSLGYGYRQFNNARPIDGSEIVLDEDPFGDDLAIPILDAEDPDDLDLPDGENDVLRILATEGLLDTNTRSHRGSASFGMNHSLTQRTSLNIGVGGGYRYIDSNDAREGTFGSARAIIQRTISASGAVSVGYTLSRTFVTVPGVAVHTLFAGWNYSPRTSSLSISLSGGASRYDAEGSPATTTPVASASLSGALTGSTTAGINYRRQFSVPSGFGRSLLIDYFNAGLTQRIGERVSARVMAGLSLASDPLDESSQRNTQRVGGSLTIRLIGGLHFGTSYFYSEIERRGEISNVDENRKNWSLYLNYSTNW